MIKLSLVFAFLFFSDPSFSQRVEGKKENISTQYLNVIFAHVHQNPSRYSQSLTTIACGHPLQIMRLVEANNQRTEVFNEEWRLVVAGPYEGYVHQDLLSSEKPKCFQDNYPRFMNALNLELTDMFYWGKLYDHFERGKSRIP